MKTAFEPEDWEGLEAYVQRSSLANKDEILDIIQGDEAPDRKDQAIKRRFPADYRVLLTECYPSLRHSDYEVAYTIRTYTDVEEIKRIFRTSPQKLSLDEFYHLAEQYEPGTDAFNEVFETAVRMYPDDAQANLNAANAAIERKDYAQAEKYLQKAGDIPQAALAKGILAAVRGDYQAAQTFFEQAALAGIKEADSNLKQIERMK
jgi:tetratricopeptide (TPR) repeat protein